MALAKAPPPVNEGEVNPLVAYLSMEVGLESRMPTYSGGLGVLAGDTLKAAADLGVPMVAVSLLHREGYFRQKLKPDGEQVELPVEWSPEELLEPMEPRVEVEIEGRRVHLRAWRKIVRGRGGFEIPLYLLDADLPENAKQDRSLTDDLYGGDLEYRLSQEILLGIGGLRLLEALGHDEIRTYHMNEGHSSLLTLGLLEKALSGGPVTEDAVAEVRRQCVFTTHTPVPAGHDKFPATAASRILGRKAVQLLREAEGMHDGVLNMTHLALHFSRYVNGVAMRHRQISSGMFPDYPVDSITNGVHVRTWVAPSFRELFDRHVPEWRDESFNLRYAVSIPLDEIRAAHRAAKEDLLDTLEERTGRRLNPEVLTLGFARRATPYKRADLLLSDPERLRSMAEERGGLQILYAGKAHPADEGGQAMIRRVHEVSRELGDDVPVVYLEDYGMALAARMVAGVDVWVNTPRKPQEASGTSGMKAAINGVPSLSVLDGWWIEGHVEGVTGWSIGEEWETESDRESEIASIYRKLEEVILPLYRERPDEFASIQRSAISLNGSFFNAERMMLQYVTNAYHLPAHARRQQPSMAIPV
ncbi:MAG: alpha-glucan family phosphorylase [Longimicrobiales bacterium]